MAARINSRKFASHLIDRWRLLVPLIAVAGLLHCVWKKDVTNAGKFERSITISLATHGLKLGKGDAFCFPVGEGSAFVAGAEMFFLAKERSGQSDRHHDVYRALVRRAGTSVLGVRGIRNLTRSSGADERALGCSRDWVSFATEVGGEVDALVALDLRGEGRDVTAGWSMRAKAQNRITNWQATGRSEGVGRRRFRLTERARASATERRDGALLITLPQGTVALARGAVDQGLGLVEPLQDVKGAPGTITWVVDTVRKIPWVGAAPIEWLEHRVFGVKDWLERKRFEYLGGEEGTTAEEVEEEMALPHETGSAHPPRAKIDLGVGEVKLGFPPPPMSLIMNKAAKGEGKWRPVEGDPYLRSYPGAPTAFYQSFIRSDPERPYTRVYVVVWDPRQLQLNIMTGTREPESATGETGPGMAPRERETLKHVVAGFNGGFQALHGEFGMMSEGRVYLPPKPWAATAAVTRDGTVKVGSWFPPPEGKRRYEESWAIEQIPEDMYALRQNLTSVVENGKYNPWDRWWWGAAPLNADEQTHIDRSGLCLTEEGFLAYFWGKSMGPEALGKAMKGARCARGMHLDMNSSHTGFEFYNVQEKPFDKPLAEEPTEDEFEGKVPLAPELYLRARRLVRSMSTMRFPRYVGRDSRDFFYLTQRPILPGPPVGDVTFSCDGVPHDGFPFAFARAKFGDESNSVHVIRIDPTRLAWGGSVAMERVEQEVGAKTSALAYFSQHLPKAKLPRVLVRLEFPKRAKFEIVGSAEALLQAEGARALLWGADPESNPDARRALGIDQDGFLVYFERGAGSAKLSDWFAPLGVTNAMVFEETRLVFEGAGGVLGTVDGFEATVDMEAALSLFPNKIPFTEVLAPENKPRPYWRWAKMQDTRVRYFREGEARFTKPEDDAGVETP